MQAQGRPADPSKPAGPMPATDDEIREKYLERAIRELNSLTRELQGCEHCPRGNLMPVLGSVRVRMSEFDGPVEFLEALRAAEIITKPSSLLYVQALKFLETKATPSGARERRRERRVRRAIRKP